jgi:NADPH-dependent 2,4-dienoyl-CoA reductase/sulfur reductase-like enzyme/nitrite reductase/ring-hydroxylating ferredoxin subunit
MEAAVADQKLIPEGPNFAEGMEIAHLSGTITKGRVGDEPAILVRHNGETSIIGALCSHYHGPLAEGLVAAGTVRCPWHHACFDLRTGEAVRAPAFSPVPSWLTEEIDGKIFARGKRPRPKASSLNRCRTDEPEKIVILGGGAAGFAAAEQLRRQEFSGSIVMLSDDSAPPVDRPNLSKDYLAGKAPEDWVPLRPASFYSKHNIDLRLRTKVIELNTRSKEVVLSDGSRLPFDRLLLATGAEPVRLSIPGADQPHVHTLRSLSDCQSIIAKAKGAQRAVVLGASFIGLEVAAALRERGIEVHIVAPDKRPFERIFGAEMGDFIRSLHEQHGVIFHLEETANHIDSKRVQFAGGSTIETDLVVLGIGVRPRTEIAERAGLRTDRGVLVNKYLQTSVPSIFAAGDIAKWPYSQLGDFIRVEHWVIAQRQGQVAAQNMLGAKVEFSDIPFFWSQHYDVPINYIGHAETWDALAIEGDIQAKDCLLRFKRHGQTTAVASIFRDVDNLQAELAMERAVAA